MQDFIKMSKYAGAREDLVQAGGGNSAFKINSGRMVIKASGIQLADIGEHYGYTVVNPERIRDAFENSRSLECMTEDGAKEILAEAVIEGNKPSIETFLHVAAGRYSLHTHPVAVNVLACRKNGKDLLKRLFPDALVVPYATPGLSLAKAYFTAYREYERTMGDRAPVVFLMNHGLLVSAETAEEVIGLTEQVTKKIENYLNIDNSSFHDATFLNTLFEDGITWRVTDHNIIESGKKLGNVWEHGFCPDCVVFLGKKICTFTDQSEIKASFQDFVKRNGYPVVISYKGSLYIHSDSVRKAMEIQSVLSFSAQVMALNMDSDCNMLSESEKNFLLNWDAEKYRKKL